MNAIDSKVKELVNDELTNANLFFPWFRSPHEGYAVIIEEKEEVEEAFATFERQFETFWMHIRNNYIQESIVSASYLKNYAIATAVEAIQTAAMCEKYRLSIGGKEECDGTES